MKKKLILLIFIVCIFNSEGLGQDNLSNFSFNVESGIHMDINNLLYPTYQDNRPYFVPEDFEYQKVLIGWNNRISVNYHFRKEFIMSLRIGFTNFKRAYEKSGEDIFGLFKGSHFIERYTPLDLLLSKRFNLNKGKSYLKIGLGPILRFYDSSSLTYGLVFNADGDPIIPTIYSFSRSFADIGISYNVAYEEKINSNVHMGINLNAYTLFYGYGLESVIISPYINLNF